MISFVNKCQIELHENPRGKAIYRRPFGGLLKRDQRAEGNAKIERKAVNVSLGRKHDVGLNESCWTDSFQTTGKTVTIGSVMEIRDWMQWHKLALMRIPN